MKSTLFIQKTMLKKIFSNIKKSERVFTGLRFKMSDSSGERKESSNSSNSKNDPSSTKIEKDEAAANNSNSTSTDSSKKEKELDESNLTDYFNTGMNIIYDNNLLIGKIL